MSSNDVHRGTALRVILVAAALVVAGWLALSLRNERLVRFSSESLKDPQAQERQIEESLSRAKTLNASLQPELLEAALLKRDGRNDEAVSILRAILTKEPRNRPVWLLLSAWLRPTDPAGANAAAERARVLDGSF